MLTRRRALGILGTAGIGTAVFQRALAAKVGDGSVSPEMVADAEWIAGIKLTPAEQEAAAKHLNQYRDSLKRIRAIDLDNSKDARKTTAESDPKVVPPSNGTPRHCIKHQKHVPGATAKWLPFRPSGYNETEMADDSGRSSGIQGIVGSPSHNTVPSGAVTLISLNRYSAFQVRSPTQPFGWRSSSKSTSLTSLSPSLTKHSKWLPRTLTRAVYQRCSTSWYFRCCTVSIFPLSKMSAHVCRLPPPATSKAY